MSKRGNNDPPEQKEKKQKTDEASPPRRQASRPTYSSSSSSSSLTGSSTSSSSSSSSSPNNTQLGDGDMKMTDANQETKLNRGWIDFTSDAEKTFYPDMKIQTFDEKTLHYYRIYIMQSDAILLKQSLMEEKGTTTELPLRIYSSQAVNTFLNWLTPTCDIMRCKRLAWLALCDALRMAYQYNSATAKQQFEIMLRKMMPYPWPLSQLEKLYNECKMPLKDLAMAWAACEYSFTDHQQAAHCDPPPDTRILETLR